MTNSEYSIALAIKRTKEKQLEANEEDSTRESKETVSEEGGELDVE